MSNRVDWVNAVLVLTGLLTLGCARWAESIGLYPDADACSYAPRDCQTHWLLCSALCIQTTDGVALPMDGRPLALDEKCDWYAKGARRHCADLRRVPFETAICADYIEGWCEWETKCMPRPASCAMAAKGE